MHPLETVKADEMVAMLKEKKKEKKVHFLLSLSLRKSTLSFNIVRKHSFQSQIFTIQEKKI